MAFMPWRSLFASRIIFLLLSHCLAFHINFVTSAFSPQPDDAVSIALVGRKIYFSGGARQNVSLFALDLSQKFSVSSPPFVDLSSSVTGTLGAHHGCGAGDNTTLWLMGGYGAEFVRSFNTTLNSWQATASKRFEVGNFPCVLDVSAGKLYGFGGTGSDPEYRNELYIYDTYNMSQSIISAVNYPLARDGHSAVLLPNKKIVFIGGKSSNNSFMSMQVVDILDTTTLKWSTQVTNGTTPGSRIHHSSVLTDDGNIIIYGGTSIDGAISQMQSAKPEIAVLNTSTWTWLSPISLSPVKPSLMMHRAVTTGKYMVIGSGFVSDYPNNFPTDIIRVMDISKYTWVETFDPEIAFKPVPTLSPNSPVSESQQTLITALVISCVAFAVVTSLVGFYKYHHYHNTKANDIILPEANLNVRKDSNNTSINIGTDDKQ